VHIFQYLPVKDLVKLEGMCSRFQALAVDDMVWSARLSSQKVDFAIGSKFEKKWWMSMKVSGLVCTEIRVEFLLGLLYFEIRTV
jgi:hypothetical protein